MRPPDASLLGSAMYRPGGLPLESIAHTTEEVARRWRGIGPLYRVPTWAQRYLPPPSSRKQIDLPFGG